MPAVMNTRSAPSRIIARSSRDSSAASRPMFGFAPAPRPRVRAVPICTVFGRLRAAQRLHVGVDGVEIDAGKSGFDHAIDRVAAAAADTDHFDRRSVFGNEPFCISHRRRLFLGEEWGAWFSARSVLVPRSTKPRPRPSRTRCWPNRCVCGASLAARAEQNQADRRRVFRLAHGVGESGDRRRHADAHRQDRKSRPPSSRCRADARRRR